MKDKTIERITAIIAVTILESINLIYGDVDGFGLSLAVGVIGGLAGYSFGKMKK